MASLPATEGSPVGRSTPPRVSFLSKVNIKYVHAALALQQMGFGGGALIAKFALVDMHPITFGCVRDAIASMLLFVIGFYIYGIKGIYPNVRHWRCYFLIGFCMFANQMGAVSGIKLYGPQGAVVSSMWQPSQPIFTLVIATLAGLEVLSTQKVIAIASGFMGAILLVVLVAADEKEKTPSEDKNQQIGNPWVGSLFFLMNCLGTSCFVSLSKFLIYNGEKALVVTIWSYFGCTAWMLCSAFTSSSIESLEYFFCQGQLDCIEHPWRIPPSGILPLVYWILVSSVFAYFVTSWANQFVAASIVSFYTVLQPAANILFTTILLAVFQVHATNRNGEEILAYPGWNIIGLFPIILGLLIILSESFKTMDYPEEDEAGVNEHILTNSSGRGTPSSRGSQIELEESIEMQAFSGEKQ